jgi:archaemetzincin
LKLKSKNKIIITPIGSQDPSLIQQVGIEIKEKFKSLTESLPLLNNINFAYDPVREQYYSTIILERLAGVAPDNAIKIIAIVNEDLFIPILTHVYGEAQLGGKACIVSSYRLRDTSSNISDVFSTRLVKEAIHELGHTFNLRHCPDVSCVMHYCRSLKDVDGKTEQFCRYCNIMLRDEMERIDMV